MLDIPQSPIHKKAKLDNSNYVEDSDSIIGDIVSELVDTSTYNTLDNNQIESNYQCGVCAKLFETEDESTKHMEEEHGKSDCSQCRRLETENKNLLDEVIKYKEEVKVAVEKNENLTKKNVNMDKEIKMLRTALKQSIAEKDRAKKELAES